MGSFSETLIDPKDPCHGNKYIYPEMTEQFHFNSVYCCEKKIKNKKITSTRSCFVFLLMVSLDAFLLDF